MKQVRKLLVVTAGISFILFGGPSCSPKYGCPSNGKNVGAERIMSGEKVKAKKFRS
jgi:hypothetical protein